MKLENTLKCLFFSCLIFFSAPLYAVQNPTEMLQNVSNRLLSELAQTKNRNDQTLYSLVKKILLPHVDLNQMSQIIIGKYWAGATSEQKVQFENEFTAFITRTYSSALSSYTNEKVRFFPIRGGVTGNHVQVNSAIDQANGSSVNVSYRLALTGGVWKVYDFSIEGASIVENYRAQFADVLRTKGLAELIRQLHTQNQ